MTLIELSCFRPTHNWIYVLFSKVAHNSKLRVFNKPKKWRLMFLPGCFSVKLVFSKLTCQANKYVQISIDIKCRFFFFGLTSSCCSRSNASIAPNLSHQRQCYMLKDWHDNIATFVCGWFLLIKKSTWELHWSLWPLIVWSYFFISLFCICYFIFTQSLRIICLNHMNCLGFPKKGKHISVGDIRLEYFSYWISADLTPNRVSRFI